MLDLNTSAVSHVETQKPQIVKNWKVRTTASGAVLTLNGIEFDLGASGHSIAFDIERAASGTNPPEQERESE